MEKVDRKSPNPNTLDIQKKPDRKWVLVCPRKQILTTQVLADTEHGQGTRLCTDGTDPENTFRSSSSHPVHVETIGQGLRDVLVEYSIGLQQVNSELKNRTNPGKSGEMSRQWTADGKIDEVQG